MTLSDTSVSLGELVTQRAGRARVFERLGLDYCCGGQLPLAEACRQKGLSLPNVLRALAEADAQATGIEVDWSRASATELVDHIVATHHAYLETELPRLTDLFEKVVRVHGERHAELHRCQDVFRALGAELDSHLMKEERVLFPLIRAMEESRSVEDVHCGTVRNPIRVMEAEHDGAGAALATLRQATGGYTPPADACASYRALLDGLARLEADLHEHIHKENNILFPRAIRLEDELSAGH
jgi:regulator of cell morphogenesis and NO signaling